MPKDISTNKEIKKDFDSRTSVKQDDVAKEIRRNVRRAITLFGIESNDSFYRIATKFTASTVGANDLVTASEKQLEQIEMELRNGLSEEIRTTDPRTWTYKRIGKLG